MKQQNIMETKLARIAEISKEKPQEIFTSIYYYLNKDLLILCHKELDGKKATGLDGITKAEYEENLEENIEQLAEELRKMSYKPSPAKRVFIPKANGKVRGLAIANYEDKIVQLALKKIIEAIYEPKFSKYMYGFRPNKSCHDALKELSWTIERKKVNGESYIIVYADDFVCCFQYQNEAEKFINKLLPGRLKKFRLEVAKDKTRLIKFGRYAKQDSKNGKVETFDFLGFTHYCGKGRNGNFRVKRKTLRKRFKAKVKEFKIWINVIVLRGTVCGKATRTGLKGA